MQKQTLFKTWPHILQLSRMILCNLRFCCVVKFATCVISSVFGHGPKAGQQCTPHALEHTVFLQVKYAQCAPHALEHTVFLQVKYAQCTPHALAHTVFLQVKYAQCTPHALAHTVFLQVKYAQCTPQALENTVYLKVEYTQSTLQNNQHKGEKVNWKVK